MAETKFLLGVVSLTLLVMVPWCFALQPSVVDEEPSVLDEIPLVPDEVPSVQGEVPSLIDEESLMPVLPTPSESTPSMFYMPQTCSLQSRPTIAAIPNMSEFNFDFVQERAASFYQTLPQTILDDAKMTVPELIKKYGYPCETHRVTTSDGYILNMHRIPYGRSGNSQDRPVVFVQHGVLSSSADWIIPGPEKALGYILADAGYDVWMPNSRGTRYSRDHVSLDPDKAKFWDFSWHEIAIYDVTASIDYALNKTKQEKLYYVGHSQGTTVFYVMCSEKPEYNDKIRVQFSLAPIGYMSHMTSPLMQVISKAEGGLGMMLKLIGVNEFVPNTGFVGRVGKLLCSDDSVTQILCTNSLFAVCGFNQKQMNATLLPVIMGHTPAGASTGQLLHYAQEVNSGKFRQWDHGVLGNLKNYGSSEIPRYRLSKVTAPVYLFYSENDWLSAERDVMRLYVELANVQEKFMITDKKFNHIDYLYAMEAPELVYDPLINLMKKHC